MNRILAALGLLAASAASAQLAPTAELEQLHLDPAARGSLVVGNGKTLRGGTFRVSTALQYSHGHLKSGGSTLLRDRFAVHLLGAVGLTHWLEVSGDLPVVVHQLSDSGGFAPSAAGLATPFIHAKLAILGDTSPVSLWASLGLGLPVGSAGALGNGGLAFAPRVNLGRNFDRVQLGAELGALVRGLGSFAEVRERVGSQLYLSIAASQIRDGLRGEASLRAFASLSGTPPGLELLFGGRYPLGELELFFLGGPGLGGTPTTPTFRLYAGAAFGNGGPPQPRCAESVDYLLSDCPGLDKDADAVSNGVDRAPLVPEDKDGFEDDDGAPDPDNDADGVLDPADACRDVKGLEANGGCPDLDTDGDGVVDRLDLAPTVPEDLDGFEDADGAPEPDNDLDRFPDPQDACPNEPGILEERGCPARDDDLDGVFNHLDNCPAVAGPAGNQGCPLEQKQLVVVTREKLKILDKVFFDTGKSTIQKRSHLLLDQIAAILADKTFIQLVQIEGHTDDVGTREKNARLSADRANAVRDYLVKKGIAPQRLKPVGFGQDQPVAPNATAAGKEANRRVEFNIVEQGP